MLQIILGICVIAIYTGSNGFMYSCTIMAAVFVSLWGGDNWHVTLKDTNRSVGG